MIEEKAAPKKYKIITVSDFPISPSGVGKQTKFIIEHLLKTGLFQVISVGVAMNVKGSQPGYVSEYGKDWMIVPHHRYDDMSLWRQIVDVEKPDLIWTMTDPRFYEEYFRYADEFRDICPVVVNSIWDNFPTPKFNKSRYDCFDFIGCINKVMFNIAKDLDLKNFRYIPHGVPKDIFTLYSADETSALKSKHLGVDKKDAFVLFYNSRNALRKRTGNCIMAFKEFLEGLPEDERKNVFFAVNSPPHDPEGQDLYRLIDDFGLRGKIGISEGGRQSDEQISEYYRLSDLTIIQSSEEGFGLSCLESLYTGCPVLSGRTGGLTDQMVDEEVGRTWGILMEPDATTLLGSQTVPYIYSHHFNYSTTAKHIRTFYDDWKSDKVGYKERWAGKEARESCLRRFNLEEVCRTWENVIVDEIEKFKARKENKEIKIIEV